VRLTRLQYESSLRDLTGLPASGVEDLPDTAGGTGFTRTVDLEVAAATGRLFRERAERVAAQLASSAAGVQRVTGCVPSDACASTFIADFGRRAFRRPLTQAEKDAYLALFRKASALLETGDAFTRGVQVVLEAFLQSPKFLYRVEWSTKAADGLIPLSGWELAARLSYALANTTPDAALLAAAERGELANVETLAAQARRLLATPAGRETLRDFHRQWMGTDEWKDDHRLDKDRRLYPAVTPALGPTLEQELDRFVETVVFDRKGGLASLFTSPVTFANRVTAAIYGVKGTFSSALQRVDLDPAQRAGILTQVGFLAANASSAQSSPIHRGTWVQRRVLCTSLPDPPAQVPALPPPAAGRTNRQVVDEHTSPEGCKVCHHGFINPVGFGFENYDAVGAWRTMDNGKPIDATGTLVATGKNLPFSNGVELSRAVAESPEARSCYARQWWRYTFARAESEADGCDIGALAQALSNDSYTTVDLLVDVVRTAAFSTRTEEK
jgi:hypothetical protein